MNCPACQNQKSNSFGTKNGYALEKCSVCKTLFAELSIENQNTSAEVQDLYDHYYDFANYKLPKAAEISLQKIVDSFSDFRQTGNFIDIGFGEGGMLSVAEKNGWKCFGTELSPQSLEYGNAKGWTVSTDAFSDERFPKEKFDVVTMVELIEHVANPDFFFETAFKLLRPNGLLFLTTPNAQSINLRFLGTEWSVISPPEHITLWSANGLKQALERNKFATLTIRTDGLNPFEIFNKIRNRGKKSEVAVNRNEAAFALNEAFTGSNWRQTVKAQINQGLSLFSLGDGIKIWAVKKS
ncbi:MAG: class I SAM-dependent methyltransferase [Pyrinomonadaceae bacterium]